MQGMRLYAATMSEIDLERLRIEVDRLVKHIQSVLARGLPHTEGPVLAVLFAMWLRNQPAGLRTPARAVFLDLVDDLLAANH
jgi:hypothetical protein